jgi:hypothetical protein
VSGPEDARQADVPTATELQRAIASVTGVATAEVTPTESGRDRLRISLRPGEDPEAVAWSVAATLRERFGIALDPAAITARVVSTPIDPTDPTDPSDPSDRTPPTVPAETGEPADRATPPAADPPGAWTSTSPPPEPPAEGQLTAPATSAAPVTPAAAAVPAAAAAPAAPAAPAAAGVPAVPPQPAERTSVGDSTSDLAVAARSAVAEPPGSGRQRAAIRELSAHPEGDALEVAATLVLSGREATGHARGLRTRRGRWRAIAEATLAALDGLAVGRVRGHVDHVTVLTFADLAHVSVSVTLLTERGEETFLGAALVRDDPDRAVMRAALDAVNRRIEPWLAEAVAEAG